MKRLAYILFCVFIVSFKCFGQKTFSDWNDFETAFVKDFKRLHIADLQIYYVDNLELIQSKRNVTKQEKVFLTYKNALQSFDYKKLTKDQQLDYALVSYEIKLHLERIALEKKWLDNKPKRISTEGLQKVQMGKEWYAYFLKKWVDAEVTPDRLFQFGLAEIERAENAMKALQEASGLDSLEFQAYINKPIFFLNDVESVQKKF